jgi:hypothetical protein
MKERDCAPIPSEQLQKSGGERFQKCLKMNGKTKLNSQLIQEVNRNVE